MWPCVTWGKFEINGDFMAILTKIRAIKQIHREDVVLVKIGDFYHVYGKDSYIVAYLMGYKLKKVDGNCPSCGFPTKSLVKIEATLESKKINYIELDRRNNYDVDSYSNNKNLNSYKKYYLKANEYLNKKSRIDNIYAYFVNNIDKKDMKKLLKNIEEIIKNEG